MSVISTLGWLAVAATLAAFFMRTMIPLRVTAIVGNVLFVLFGGLSGALPALVPNAVKLPFNIWRLKEMLELTEKVRIASQGDLNMEWLKPFMSKRAVKAGEVLFRNGEVASAMFYTITGRYRLVENDADVPPGQVIGEIGLIAPDNRRTLTLVRVEDGEMLTITYGQVKQLYYQNPQFGSHFFQLTSARLFYNIRRLEERVAAPTAA